MNHKISIRFFNDQEVRAAWDDEGKRWQLNQLDSKSRDKAYQLWESSLLQTIEVGTTKGLLQIHAFLFGGLYDFAGQIRQKNIAKGGFQFAVSRFLGQTLRQIERMPETTLDEIVEKYVEMNRWSSESKMKLVSILPSRDRGRRKSTSRIRSWKATAEAHASGST